MEIPQPRRSRAKEALGDRIIKVDHAGEHGAVCIYRAQKFVARWRAPSMLAELDHFLSHEIGHRSAFASELARRNRGRCKSYWLCGLGGTVLGLVTGLAGAKAINATTVAIERVVLQHMHEQIALLESLDEAAASLLRRIIVEEQEHHDVSSAQIPQSDMWQRLIEPVVAWSTESVIWLGMKL